MNPWLHLVADQPHLLAEHAQAYADLAAVQIAGVSADWKQRALLIALASGGLLLAATFGGVALMLWSVAAAPQLHHTGFWSQRRPCRPPWPRTAWWHCACGARAIRQTPCVVSSRPIC